MKYAGRPPELPNRRRWLFRILYLGYLLVIVELGFRGYLWWQYGVRPADLSNRVDAIQLYYPELTTRKITESRINDEELQVLLLGGSVAEQVGQSLQQAVSAALKTSVIVHNAAVSAHTTQDSLNKLEYLLVNGAEFNAILIYHGINDVRMNCVSAEDFRDDYTHCHWYASFNRKQRQGSISLRQGISESLDYLIGLGEPEAEYVSFGSEIKTGPAVQAHLEKMLQLASQKQIPVALLSFATHFVDGYTKAAFQAGRLGYADGAYGLATEVWGDAENVRRGVQVHNDIIRQIVANHSDLPFIDVQRELIDIRFFTDVCHLSPQGIEEFVKIVVGEIQRKQLLQIRRPK